MSAPNFGAPSNPSSPARAKTKTTNAKRLLQSAFIYLCLSTYYTAIQLQARASDNTHQPQQEQNLASSQTSSNQSAQVPEAARCLLEPGNVKSSSSIQHLKPVKSPSVYDQLLPYLGHDTGVSLRRRQQQAPSRQVPFESVCHGWHNELSTASLVQASTTTMTHKLPVAFWVLDPVWGALVAKFVHKTSIETYHEARLVSPWFRPLPSFIGMQTSHYYNSCQLSYHTFFAVTGHLTVNLVLADETGQRMTMNEMFVGKGAVRKERRIWEAHRHSLPVNLGEQTPYQVEFVLSIIWDANMFVGVPMGGQPNAIALANITLSSFCFTLDNQTELVRLRKESGREPLLAWPSQWQPDRSVTVRRSDATMWQSLGRYVLEHLGVFSLLLIALIGLIVWSQVVLFVNLRKTTRARSRYLFGPDKFYCCCLSFGLNSTRPRVGRSRVRAASMSNGPEPGAGADQEKSRLNGIPLSCILSADPLELLDNQHYLPSGGEACRAAAIERALHDSLQRFHIERSRLSLTEELGQGAFGRVYRGCLLVESDTEASQAMVGGGCCVNPVADDPSAMDTSQEGGTSSGNSLSATSSHSLKVAVKTCTEERLNKLDFMREASNMALARHPNIVQLLGVCFDDRPLYIVMELCEGGNLKNFLLRNRHKQGSQSTTPIATDYYNQLPLSRPSVQLCMGDLLVFALDICRACAYLQSHAFIHRDLAARNCLLTSTERRAPVRQVHLPAISVPTAVEQASESDANNNDNDHDDHDLEEPHLNGFRDSGMVAKLADFGMTREVHSTDYYRTAHKEMPALLTCNWPIQVRWMPPESLDGVATLNSDVWSFGVLLWELFSVGQLPYQHLPNNHQVIEFIRARRHAYIEPGPTPTPGLSQVSAEVEPLDATTELLLTVSTMDEVSRVQVVEDPPQKELPPLPKPHQNTPDQIYQLMGACWATEPCCRPTFKQVADKLIELLKDEQLLEAPLPIFQDNEPFQPFQRP